MCGITGFIDWKNRSNENILESMNKTLNHKGPDSGDIKIFHTDKFQVGFGHKRLAIIDITETGKQPMQFEHLWTIFVRI